MTEQRTMDEEERAGQEGVLFKQCNIFSWYSNLDHRHLLKIGIDVFLKLMFLNPLPPGYLHATLLLEPFPEIV